MKSRKIIAGVDEVGRGSLVGSVFSAAVILKNDQSNIEFKDSKKLTEKKRILICDKIINLSICVSIGVATKDEIDSMNIHHATLLSMRRAINNLTVRPNLILIDGLHVPKVDICCQAVVKGDTKINEISAASIVAKVARDFEMNFLHERCQMYNFNQNNGYGTEKHLRAIECYGKTIYHRNTFINKNE